jgi:hypothetical protein
VTGVCIRPGERGSARAPREHSSDPGGVPREHRHRHREVCRLATCDRPRCWRSRSTPSPTPATRVCWCLGAVAPGASRRPCKLPVLLLEGLGRSARPRAGGERGGARGRDRQIHSGMASDDGDRRAARVDRNRPRRGDEEPADRRGGHPRRRPPDPGGDRARARRRPGHARAHPAPRPPTSFSWRPRSSSTRRSRPPNWRRRSMRVRSAFALLEAIRDFSSTSSRT